MIDEEMAEEYFKSVCEDYNEELERTGKRHYWVGFDIKNAYLAGLEAGRPKWHDLRKNPKDLPNENEIVLCYCLGYCGVSFPITARLYIDYNDANVKRWWTIAGEGKSEQLNNVIAWKEIVQPEVKI